MKREDRNIFLAVCAILALLLLCVAWVVGVWRNNHAGFMYHVLFIALGYTSVTAIVFGTSWLLSSRQADIVIVVRPNVAAQEHHKIIKKLGSLETERATLLARKEALETPDSESAKYIALSNERIS